MKSKRGRPIYSPLHKFVNKELVAAELAQPDIVTSVAQKKFQSIVAKRRAAGILQYIDCNSRGEN